MRMTNAALKQLWREQTCVSPGCVRSRSPALRDRQLRCMGLAVDPRVQDPLVEYPFASSHLGNCEGMLLPPRFLRKPGCFCWHTIWQGKQQTVAVALVLSQQYVFCSSCLWVFPQQRSIVAFCLISRPLAKIVIQSRDGTHHAKPVLRELRWP